MSACPQLTMLELTDPDIKALIAEPKTWPGRGRIELKRELRHKRADKDLEARSGHLFRVFVRQLDEDPLDFTVGLVFRDKATGEGIRLLRCNGPHRHPNRLEGDTIDRACHVHMATEKYIMANRKEDGWAYESADYRDLDSAVSHFAKVANITPVPYITKPLPETLEMFDES
jgi:hypothetical protein